ncbi:secretin N-terminal domain-containing protein [Chitinibacter fontanus]|uniref:Secretin N-terminal domain-containing protein n=1 Tax=Chitinibacter fontanus TaxID=1737446 RepID=A0A7D5ZHA9_9NEIS|nr:secretin N-terminal domain-containing protein [Chitinibacter fontanus]QLI81827.1 secretin N-terminal domain-containing protein [Chitinibacter fontanus]
MKPPLLPILIASALSACATQSGLPNPEGRHLDGSASADAQIPKPVAQIPYLPKPSASPKLETYSVVVSQLPVNSLLFALARDAKINVDVHPDVQGVVTLNAIKQTLPQILDRIAKQVDIRWSLENDVLTITPDQPYLKTYRLDYFNLSRNMKASVTILNSVSTGAQTGSNSSANSSSTSIESENLNQFWKRLEANLKEMLGVKEGGSTAASSATQPVTAALAQQISQSVSNKSTDPKSAIAMVDGLAKVEKTVAQTEKTKQESAPAPVQPAVASAGKLPNLVILNPESGTVTVRASHKEQLKVAEFLAAVQSSAQRQVMIEATIVEVALGDQYQAGVDWSKIASGSGWSLGQSLLGANLSAAPVSALTYTSGNFTATIKMLEQFGRTRVLSSPKIIALNNQTAVMKVVEEQVYFTLELEEDKNTDGVVTGRTYTSTLHTVPVGLVMQVTPQISEGGSISMNVRPTITNISSYVEDPAVALISQNSNKPVQSLIPVLQVREFDSTLKISSGQAAVLGGLIQDKQTNSRQGVPGLSRVPWLGDAFSYRDDKVSKIELVVFLRPIIVHENGVNGEQSAYKQFMPAGDYFNVPEDHQLSAFQSGSVPLPAKVAP